MRVRQKLRDFVKARNQDLSERDLNRLISLAAGTVFGITGEGFDILSQAKPPPIDSNREITGYFADNILPYWNLPHLFERFGIPGKVPELLYLKVMKGGKLPFTKEGQWDYRILEKAREQGVKELKTGLLWSLSGGPPLIEVMSKNFGIRGVLSRGGWRILALTSHHLVGKEDDDGKQLPVFSSPINWEADVSDKEQKDIDAKTGLPRKVANQMLWENIDWEKSFKNLEKAGTGVMFSYWIDKRIDAEAGHDGQKKAELTKKYYNEYLWKTRNRNPLIFLRYDLAQSHKTSLRYRALGRVDEYKDKRNDFNTIKSEIDEIERDLMMVTEEITRRHAWSDEGGEGSDKWSAWDVIKFGEKREKAKKYWKALQVEIWEENADGTPKKEPGKAVDEIRDNFFKEKYFFFGSEDMDFRETAMREAGFDVMKRAFGDINTLSKGVEEFMSVPDKLIAAAEAHNYKELIGSIDKICHAVESVHGVGEARRMAYYLTTMMTRYFDKSWWTQLPLGVGTVLNWITRSSLSEKVGGKRAWQWDEEKTAAFINDVRLTGYLETDKTKEFSIHMLRAETGARNVQAIYDILRTAIPLIILLMMWQAAKEETKS